MGGHRKSTCSAVHSATLQRSESGQIRRRVFDGTPREPANYYRDKPRTCWLQRLEWTHSQVRRIALPALSNSLFCVFKPSTMSVSTQATCHRSRDNYHPKAPVWCPTPSLVMYTFHWMKSEAQTENGFSTASLIYIRMNHISWTRNQTVLMSENISFWCLKTISVLIIIQTVKSALFRGNKENQ